MQQFIDWCVEHWSVTVFVLALFIDFTPGIKFNPVKTVLRWVGKVINGELEKELESVKTSLKEQQESINENEKDRIRWEVLDFANSCRNGRKHTKDEFEHIIVITAKYHALLEKTDDTNGVFDAEYDYIYELYQKCQRENTFI